MILRSLRLAAFALAPLCAMTAVHAQSNYPSRPITLVVPYGPGASADATARMVGQKVAEDLGQPVVVDNRAGAAGMIGSAYATGQAPDGYTILLGTDGTHTGNPHVVKDHPFDAIKDSTPLTMAARNIIVLVAHPSVPANSMKELIEYGKKNPGKLAYGTSGNASPHHLSGELLSNRAGIEMVHVPYKGGGPALNDVLGGQIPLVFSSLVTALPHIQAGKLKALGITEGARFQGAPDIPTIAETLPGYEMTSWLAFFGPAGMPPEVVKTLNASLVKALRSPDVQPRLEASGLLVVANSPEAFAADFKKDYDARGELIRRANITAQ